MSFVSRPHAYSKVEKEDPEEVKHRRAQFLIYKVLERAENDFPRRSPSSSYSRVRICKLRIKIGKRLKRLRKSSVVLTKYAAKGAISQLKTWKRLFHILGGQATVKSFPPRPVFG